MKSRGVFCLFLFIALCVNAQKSSRRNYQQCGTMERLDIMFEQNPSLKRRFEEDRSFFNRRVRSLTASARSTAADGAAGTVYTIPVVFHIVLSNPGVVTDAQVQAQLDVLNKSFSGNNADSSKVPAYFKTLAGKSAIRFCLAQRTPDNNSTPGIERITTTRSSFSTNDAVKHTSGGGIDAWNSNLYYNIWICTLSNNVLGYSTFPGDGIQRDQGTVIDYRTLPGGSFTSYNTGKTLVHETGHYFNLYHIWGDDDGACSGTDYVDDTPNQAGNSSGCSSGIKTDNCTPVGNGIMYQDYMDYSSDACLVMFTNEQVNRMEASLQSYRAALKTSKGCIAPVSFNYNAHIVSIDQPEQRLCSPTFTPIITVRNMGNEPLTSLSITTKIDGGTISKVNWTGALAKLVSVSIPLNNLSISEGDHVLTVRISDPSGKTDEDSSDDSLQMAFQFVGPVNTVREGFENIEFPPKGWDLVNTGSTSTWKPSMRGIAKTGTFSVMMDNFNNSNAGETDDLRMPGITLQHVDSAFLSFQVAAAAYTGLNTPGNVWDTLQVLASSDCGLTYTSLYKNYGSSLVTRTGATTSAFIPFQSEWRRDSVNLAAFIGQPNVMLVFRNINGYENNIYLDDINVRKVVVNPNLKSQGILVTPNPTFGPVTIQFYPQPTTLRGIQVFNATGQIIYSLTTGNQVNNIYTLDITRRPPGTYLVRITFSDKVVTKKIIKY